jgi:hypothetical protein
MFRYRFELSEEIARWAFEVHLALLPEWHLAFTNPTAGPWKRLVALDAGGNEVEVHRFRREENRPDLVLVNDGLRVIVIVEAKGRLAALVAREQVEKSCAVVQSLAGALAKLVEHSEWRSRIDYTVVPGLLWGATNRTAANARDAAFATYSSTLAAMGFEAPGCVGIEVLRTGDDLDVDVTCDAAGSDDELVSAVVASLGPANR